MGIMKWFGRCCGRQNPRGSTRQPRSETRVANILSVERRKLTVKIDLKKVIQTDVKKENIDVSQFTPRKEEKQKYRFRCSICYAFFSNIMHCSECKNYVCVFDLEKYLMTAMKEGNKAICPFCSWQPVVFKDVDPEVDKVKHYFSSSESQSEVSSASSNFKKFLPSEESKEVGVNEYAHQFLDSPKMSPNNRNKLICLNSNRRISKEREGSVRFLSSVKSERKSKLNIAMHHMMSLDRASGVLTPKLLKTKSMEPSRRNPITYTRTALRKLPTVSAQIKVVPKEVNSSSSSSYSSKDPFASPFKTPKRVVKKSQILKNVQNLETPKREICENSSESEEEIKISQEEIYLQNSVLREIKNSKNFKRLSNGKNVTSEQKGTTASKKNSAKKWIMAPNFKGKLKLNKENIVSNQNMTSVKKLKSNFKSMNCNLDSTCECWKCNSESKNKFISKVLSFTAKRDMSQSKGASRRDRLRKSLNYGGRKLKISQECVVRPMGS